MSEGSKKNLWLIGIITILSIIPLVYTWGRLMIGGDTMIPLSSFSLEKYFYQWLGIQNGQYFSINYYPLYVFYKFLELFHFDIYIVSSLLVFILNITAGYGVYMLAKLFSTKDNSVLYAVPILFYLLSPALLNGWHYLYIYSTAPWFFYFILKWIKSRRIEVTDILWVNMIIFFSSLDLPNPKYLFHFFLIATLVIGLSIVLRLMRFNFFVKNSLKLVIIVISFTYLTLPLFYFVTHYTPESYGVHIKKGYKDQGSMPDYGSATLDKMMQLHHRGLNLNLNKGDIYASSNLISFLSYVFIIITVFTLFTKHRHAETARYTVIFVSVIVVYLFFASGSNPPFGSLYEALVEKFSVLAFLRTTAGAVFFLSIFYALTLFIFLESLTSFRRMTALSLTLVILIVGYPLLNGEFYQNNSATSQYANANEYGMKVPDEYFKIKEVLDKRKLDAKVLFPKMDSSYISTTWGYFGPPLYYFIFNNPVISFDKIYSRIPFHNVGFVIQDNSLIEPDANAPKQDVDNLRYIAKENFLVLSETDGDTFLPHLYVPKKIVISRKGIEQASKMVSQDVDRESVAVFTKGESRNDASLKSLTDTASGNAQLEFKKINLTKYRVRLHGAHGIFPLVFSEGFHSKWKTYLMRKDNIQVDTRLLSQYKILDGNEEDQANSDELVEYLRRGWVTALGSGNKERIAHKKWENNREASDYNEMYTVDFISKNFQGTIQNDNLPNGMVWETWFKQPLDDNSHHLTGNGYANAWVLDTDKICDTRGKPSAKEGIGCVKNQDGTYDFEMVIEFWPQRLAVLGWLISGAVLIPCLMYTIFLAVSQKRKFMLMTKSENTVKMVQ